MSTKNIFYPSAWNEGFTSHTVCQILEQMNHDSMVRTRTFSDWGYRVFRYLEMNKYLECDIICNDFATLVCFRAPSSVSAISEYYKALSTDKFASYEARAHSITQRIATTLKAKKDKPVFYLGHSVAAFYAAYSWVDLHNRDLGKQYLITTGGLVMPKRIVSQPSDLSSIMRYVIPDDVAAVGVSATNAEHLGPAHFIVDGVISSNFTNARFNLSTYMLSPLDIISRLNNNAITKYLEATQPVKIKWRKTNKVIGYK